MEVVFTNKIDEIDLEKLMDIYEESNWENIQKAYNLVGGLNNFYENEKIYQIYKDAYISYLKDDFFANKENYLIILKDKDTYLSALRLHYRKDYYLIEALETNPNFRNKGYGERLMSEVLKAFPYRTVFRSEVAISNEKSLGLHKKLGFKIIEKNENNLVLSMESD